MEFPVGVHHYFDRKVCTFHYWFLYVKPKKGWEEYLKSARAESAAAGYLLTVPPEELVKAVIAGAVVHPNEGASVPAVTSAGGSEPAAPKEAQPSAQPQQQS